MRYGIRFRCLLIGIFIFNLKAWAQYDASASLSLGMGHGYTALSQSVMTNAFAASSDTKTTTPPR